MKDNLELMVGNDKISTRQCKKSDYNFIFSLIKETLFPFVKEFFEPSKEMFDQRFAKDYQKRMILLDKDEEIGFYQLTPSKGYLTITGIFLSPSLHRKGIGKKIMKHFETLGYDKIRLQVWENNPAVNFYEKLGYKIISKKSHKYLMEKIIDKE